MNRYWRHVSFLASLSTILLVGTLIGCSGSRTSSDSDPSEITREQIERIENVSSAYAVVQRLRPNWLRKRGPTSISNPSDILVYVEGSRYGPPESLRRINTLDIESMRFLSDDRATMRYGTGHDHGVIEVTLRGS